MICRIKIENSLIIHLLNPTFFPVTAFPISNFFALFFYQTTFYESFTSNMTRQETIYSSDSSDRMCVFLFLMINLDRRTYSSALILHLTA